ncbi:regulatory protein [Xenorhabdus stockiae]|uniref:Regulatory protein n=1 Tax=Xenorhabdus stockiae TaxID=351614 RepID=A0A2D0KWE0_9GAMM|nr:regulatory protein [Xenorhabdus stockiae]
MSALEVMIKKAGGVPALTRILNIRDQAIRQWIKRIISHLQDTHRFTSKSGPTHDKQVKTMCPNRN